MDTGHWKNNVTKYQVEIKKKIILLLRKLYEIISICKDVSK